MSDITEAPTQDAIAESLMGEPQEEPTAEVTGTEPQEVQTEETQTAQPEQEELQETAEDWLPTEQDKVFADDVLLRYAERYQKDAQWLSDPLNRQLLTDKLNSDIYLRQQQEFEPEAEAEPEPTQPQPQLTREQYFANLERMIQERTDPEVAKNFHADFLRAFGVPETEIAKVPPQQATQFTHVASKYMLNLVNTFMGDMLTAQLGQQVNQIFPGFGQMYERSAYAMAWDQVRNSSPAYGDFPAYGTKEFSKLLHEATEKFPELVEAMEGPDGKIPVAQAGRAYSLLARIASGQNVDPALLQRAAQSQARNLRRAEVRRSVGNLGSGQSQAATGRSGSSKFQTNTDLFDDEAMEIYKKQHGRL